MYSESRVVVCVHAHAVVIDVARRIIEVRRVDGAPTPDDTVINLYRFHAVTHVTLYIDRDGAHRLILALGPQEAIDLGAEMARSHALHTGRKIAGLFDVALDIYAGDYSDLYQREAGLSLRRSRRRELIEATLIDEPGAELTPWISEVSDITSAQADLGYDPLDERGLTVDDLFIHIEAEPSDAYDDGPFAMPRVRTAPEVEAVCPTSARFDPPPLRPEAEERVRKAHRPPREPRFNSRARFEWLRALKEALS